MNNENKLPDTVKHPESFIKSQWYIECPDCGKIIGFDGVFPWGWIIEEIKKVNPLSKITPMDFDCVVERKSHYLIIETKDVGVDIESGQLITLNNLKRAKSFTIMKIWGKENPKEMIIDFRNGKSIKIYSMEEMREYVSRWYKWANESK